MMNDKVVDGSLVVLGVLQIYSMFLPDVSSVPDTSPEIIHEQEIHASVAVLGLTAVAVTITKSWFPAFVAIGTSMVMIGMYEHALRSHCGCGGE